ncbi:MAG: TorF family putative porin [Amaricoccus sp.]|uniref:TorF family putative porin n=1 Tax=Amaricoccus sp. TaxID=1872485 RepID=UPI0039E31CDA
MIGRILGGLALAGLCAGGAAAQQRPELSYGFAITSNYIDDGATQSNDNPAVQGYVEGSLDIFYAGLWSSTVDFPGDDDFGRDRFEFDLYAGVRKTFDLLTLDASYYRYLYDRSGDCCGEFKLAASYPMADLGALNAEFDYDPSARSRWGEVGTELYFAQVWSVGGTVGTDFGSDDLDERKVAYDVGVNRKLGGNANVDLRYYDSNLDPGHVVVAIGMDF